MTSQVRAEPNLVEGVSLSATAAKFDDKTWKVELSIENGGTSLVYVYDRLWDIDSGKQVRDPELVYRFERNGALRLLFAPAPAPRKFTTTYRNIPHTTPLEPGQSKKVTLLLASPVNEYNLYFPMPKPADASKAEEAEGKLPVEAKTVDSIEIGVLCLAHKPELKKRPAVDSEAVDFEKPTVQVQQAKLLRTKVATPGLVVNRRTDYFERVAWPGEPNEPLAM